MANNRVDSFHDTDNDDSFLDLVVCWLIENISKTAFYRKRKYQVPTRIKPNRWKEQRKLKREFLVPKDGGRRGFKETSLGMI